MSVGVVGFMIDVVVVVVGGGWGCHGGGGGGAVLVVKLIPGWVSLCLLLCCGLGSWWW